MTKTKRYKHKGVKDEDIDLFCNGVEEVLAKINDRVGAKQNKKRKDKTEEAQLASK
jgi:hypothetical protein